MAKIHIYKAKNKQWAWNLKAANGRILASGHGFNRKSNCQESVDLVCELMHPCNRKIVIHE